MAAIEPYPRAPRDPDTDAATITRLRKEIADLKASALAPPEGYVLIQNIDAKRLCDGDINSPGWQLSCRRVRACMLAESPGDPE